MYRVSIGTQAWLRCSTLVRLSGTSHSMQCLCITYTITNPALVRVRVTDTQPFADCVSSMILLTQYCMGAQAISWSVDFEIIQWFAETCIVLADDIHYKVIFQQNKNLCKTINLCSIFPTNSFSSQQNRQYCQRVLHTVHCVCNFQNCTFKALMKVMLK